jgi:hypothetical protein
MLSKAGDDVFGGVLDGGRCADTIQDLTQYKELTNSPVKKCCIQESDQPELVG